MAVQRSIISVHGTVLTALPQLSLKGKTNDTESKNNLTFSTLLFAISESS